MRSFSRLFLLFSVFCLASLPLTSCGGDDDDDEPGSGKTELEVSPSSISLISSANAQGAFTVVCNGSWNITGAPSWLNISSRSGSGNQSITVTAISANDAATTRSCELLVTSGDATRVVEVSQLAALASGCGITVSDKVELSNSVAYKLSFESSVSYFYWGYLSGSAAGWTDQRIVNTLVEEFNAYSPEDGYVISNAGLSDGETGIMCVVGFDSAGNRGELLKINYTTPDSSNAPETYISDVKYNSSYWLWTTTINATTSEYYMAMWQGELATSVAMYLTPAEVAMVMREAIAAGNMTSYIQSQEWRAARTGDAVFITTWSLRNSAYSSVLGTFYGTIGRSSVISHDTAAAGRNERSALSKGVFGELKRNISVIADR